MATRQARGHFRDLDLIVRSGSLTGFSDTELLVRFADRRGDEAEAAFEAIVARHGPMVLRVCRGVLRHPSDAEDAFQATFLVLAEKASSVRVADTLGPWLYGVARRVATKARSIILRRQARETTGVEADAEVESVADAYLLDALPILFEELDHLPEKYRSPVVLCHLEGLSHEAAARRLRWPVGTLSGRLSRARDLLRSRLARRGLGVSTAPVAWEFLQRNGSAVPPALLRLTARSSITYASGGPLPNSILSLTQGVLIAMFLTKLRIAEAGLLVVAVVGSGACGLLYQAQSSGGITAPRAMAQAGDTEKERATTAIEKSGGKLWAAITVRWPLEREGEATKRITVYFALVNDGHRAVTPGSNPRNCLLTGKNTKVGRKSWSTRGS